MKYKLKEKLLQTTIKHLQEDVNSLELIALKEKSFATSNEMQQEGKYDTRKVEASYLAGAQARRVEELKANLTIFEKFNCEDYSLKNDIGIGSLVKCKKEELENGSSFYFFISPGVGGQTIELDNKTIQFISKISPLGKALLNSMVGESFELKTPKIRTTYTIIGQV